MNAVKMLKEDHRKVEELFEQVEENENGDNSALFEEIKSELEVHTEIEESVFYPFLSENGDEELQKLVLEAIEEHRQAKMFLKEIAALTEDSEKFDPKLKVLKEDIEHHVEEEEGEMFPMVESQFDKETLEELGSRMEEERRRAQRSRAATV